jgi:hypothetical protein
MWLSGNSHYFRLHEKGILNLNKNDFFFQRDFYDLYGGEKFATLSELVQFYSKYWF